MVISFLAAVSGVVLLILGIVMPGTITLIGGSIFGLIAAMEWRCRERPVPVIIVKPPEAISVVVLGVGPPAPTQPLSVK
jgi:hypothetical protein